MSRRLLSLFGVFVFVWSATASAQEVAEPAGFSLERMRLTPSRTGLLDTEWAAVPRGLTWDVGLWLGYARNPLVLRDADGTRLGSLLQDRVGGSVVAAVSFLDRVQVGLELPVVLLNERPAQVPGVVVGNLASTAGVGVGDLRVMPKVGLLRHEDHGIDLAVLASVEFPTGGGSRYLGSQGFLIQPEVAVSRPFGNVRAALNVGAAFRTSRPHALDLSIGHELISRLALAYRFNQVDTKALPLELGVTALAGFALQQPFQNANQTPVELKAYASYDVLPFMQLFAAGGVGLFRGWGVPDWRALGGLRFFSPVEPPKVAEPDSDGDGLADSVDACPKEAGPVERNGCPVKDRDGDGVVDEDDACPDKAGRKDLKGCPDVDTDGDGIVDRLDKCPKQAEDLDGFEDEDGCPDPDNDGDGVVDTADACPLVVGPVENRGCPDVDTDGDGLVDRLDNCPTEPGPQKNNGCALKQLVVLEAGRVRVLEKVEFKTGSAIIDRKSHKLLDNVVKVLAAHPEITRVRVEGHTDSVGDDTKNLKLSQARAESVKAYLVSKGIKPESLLPVGFGETRPLDSNKTAAGRGRNRRVEFNIINEESSEQSP